MSKRTLGPRPYVEDMLQYCNYILDFTAGTTVQLLRKHGAPKSVQSFCSEVRT